MEPDLHVLSGPSQRVQRTDTGADSLGSGPGPRGREPVPRRGQNTQKHVDRTIVTMVTFLTFVNVNKMQEPSDDWLLKKVLVQ